MKGQPKRTLQHLFSGSREPDDLRSCLRKADPGMRGISRRSAAFSAGTEKAFVRTLGLTAETTVDPDHSHLFAAMGAAMESTEKDTVPIDTLIERLKQASRSLLKCPGFRLYLKVTQNMSSSAADTLGLPLPVVSFPPIEGTAIWESTLVLRQPRWR